MTDWGRDASWSHNAEDKWGEQFPISVNGKRQSPIDILTRELQSATYPSYKVERQGNGPLSWEVENTGHTIVVADKSGKNKWVLSGGNLDGNYELDHFHFHWGKAPGTGAEHLIDGKSYDGEIHFVFKLAAGQGKADSDGAVAVGLFLVQGEATDSAYKNDFDMILKSLSNISDKPSKVSTGESKVDYATLIPCDNSGHYTYQGSLTTPPFAEIVRHLVYKAPLTLSRELFEKLRAVKDHHGGPITNNYRACQPVLGRVVTAA